MTVWQPRDLSRRDLLRAAAGGSALVALGACTSPGGGGPGMPRELWHLTDPAVGYEVAGYVDHPSLDRGGPLTLHLNCLGGDAGRPVAVSVYRTGWYDGVGAVEVHSTEVVAPAEQPLPSVVDPLTNRCRADWAPVLTFPTATAGVPWPSGVYVIRLTAQSGKQSYVPFTLRDDASTATVLVVQSHLTWQAYNTAGGHDLYNDGTAVSFQRPYKLEPSRASNGAGEYFWLEYRIVRWLERNGVNATYVADFDLHRAPVPAATKVVLFCGHAEYWTQQMRDNVESSMATRGTGLVVLGANTCYWRGRLENITASTPGDYVLWKPTSTEPHPDDPLKDDPLLSSRMYRMLPGGAEQLLLGGQFRGWVDANAYPGPLLNSTAMVADDVTHPVFAGTGIARGDRFEGLCGGEHDRLHDGVPGTPSISTAFRTPLDWVYSNFHDLSVTEFQESALHEKSFPGGVTARVFNAGTYTWAWGLDDFSFEPYRYQFAHPGIQHLTTNILRWAAHEPI